MVLRDTILIVLAHFQQALGDPVHVLLYHIAAIAVTVNVGGCKLPHVRVIRPNIKPT